MSARLGWLVLVPGLVMYIGYIAYVLIAEDASPTFFKISFVAVVLGLAILFFSVLRQRIHERKNDRYKDVEL